MRNEIIKYVHEKYGTLPEHLWKSYPSYLVLRHAEQPDDKKAKWYAIIMDVKRSSLGCEYDADDYVDILNIKVDPEMSQFLRQMEGYLPPFHMAKQTSWISILLDGTVPLENICPLIDISFEVTAGGKGKRASRTGPRDWLVPANPKYYDIVEAFARNEIIDWKQSSDVRVGDLVYMYVAAPYSAILYKCKAVEVDIPWNYADKKLTVKKLMRIQLLASYDPAFMTFDRMKENFGVYAVRGPRSMPPELKDELTAYEGRADRI